MSEHQLTIHYEKHHKTYVDKLNAAIEEAKAALDNN
jgi:superoxide dismutase